MKDKKLFGWSMIMAVAILGSAAIIFQDRDQELSEPGTPKQPGEAAAAFYSWYLDYIGSPGTDNFQNPLVDRAYQESPYLTAGFIGHVDEILTEFEGPGGYDPFLCAQDIPREVAAVKTFYHNGLASVVMGSDFPNHFITLDLQPDGDDWLISNIVCGNSPEGLVKAFYTWYLGYINNQAAVDRQNPLVDKAYRESGFLSSDFIRQLDELTAGDIPADPILMAQDIPQDFSVDPGTEPGTAIVHLRFGSDSIIHLKIQLVEEGSSWKVDRVRMAQ